MIISNTAIEEKLGLLGESFRPFLYESNPNVVAMLQMLDFDEDRIRKTELFDWFQGVGLYGYYKYYKLRGDFKYLRIMLDYFDDRIKDGLPDKNINSMAPMLTLIHLYEDGMIPDVHYDTYESIIQTWAEWLYDAAPRTKEGGLAHMTSVAVNDEELWDDTLFMAVLFLAKAGIVFKRKRYVEEAAHQFMIHKKYLADSRTGLWFHGYTFNGNHNFVEARWARGNAWITIFVPEMLQICESFRLSETVFTAMKQSWRAQVRSLMAVMGDDGLWPTLLDDPDSYKEASATAGFLWGIQMGRRLGLLEEEPHLARQLQRVVQAVIKNVNETGVLENVSGGTAMGKDCLDFYRDIPLVPKPYGQAMAMGALIETMQTDMVL